MESVLIALGSAVGGGLLAIFVGAANAFVLELIKNSREDKLNARRKNLLKEMLNHEGHKWRKLTTLSRVIGANEELTIKLLLELDARGSEGDELVWGLISRNPLP